MWFWVNFTVITVLSNWFNLYRCFSGKCAFFQFDEKALDSLTLPFLSLCYKVWVHLKKWSGDLLWPLCSHSCSFLHTQPHIYFIAFSLLLTLHLLLSKFFRCGTGFESILILCSKEDCSFPLSLSVIFRLGQTLLLRSSSLEIM